MDTDATRELVLSLSEGDQPESYRATLYEATAQHKLGEKHFSFDQEPVWDFDLGLIDGAGGGDDARCLAVMVRCGTALFQMVLNGNEWNACAERGDGRKLALAIDVDPRVSHLERLPWELLHDGTEFLSAGKHVTVTRHLRAAKVPDATAETLSVCGFFSSPVDGEESLRLDIEREQAEIHAALAAAASLTPGDLWLDDEATLARIRRSLDGRRWSVLHVSCHAGSDDHGPYLILEDDEGRARPVGASELIGALGAASGPPGLVFLAGCHTAGGGAHPFVQGFGAALAEAGVPASMAMQFATIDRGAIALAGALYRELAVGRSVRWAVWSARRAALANPSPAVRRCFASPVLFLGQDGPLCRPNPSAEQRTQEPEASLAVATGPFIGQRGALRRLNRCMSQSAPPLLVIHGPWGIGKTRLAKAALARLGEAGGLCVIDAADCPDGAREVVRHLFAWAVEQGAWSEAVPGDGRGSLPKLLSMLSQRHCCVLLDGWDSFLTVQRDAGANRNVFVWSSADMAQLFESLVRWRGDSRIVITSRTRFAVPPHLGAAVKFIGTTLLGRAETLSLMRGMSGLRTLSLAKQHDLYEQLGGHPELVRRSATIQEGIEQGTDGILRGAVEQAEIARLYSFLSRGARALLDWVFGFRRPFPGSAVGWVVTASSSRMVVLRPDPSGPGTIEDAAAGERLPKELASPEMAEKWPRHLEELVDFGLLTADGDDSSVAYQFPQLVRTFVKQRRTDGLWRARMQVCAKYYLTQESASSELDRADFRLNAFELLREAGNNDQAATMLAREYEVLSRLGRWHELEEMAESILPETTGAARAGLLEARAICRGHMGRPERIAAEMDQAHAELEAARGEGAAGQEAAADIAHLHTTAWGLVLQGRLGEGQSLLERAEVAAARDEAGGGERLARILITKGTLANLTAHFETARTNLQNGLDLATRAGFTEGVLDATMALGQLENNLGHFDEALRLLVSAAQGYEARGNRAAAMSARHQLGIIYLAMEQPERALPILQECLEFYRDCGERAGSARVEIVVAQACREAGDLANALEHANVARDEAVQMGDEHLLANIDLETGNIHQAAHDFVSAHGSYEHALRSCVARGYHLEAAKVWASLGTVALRMGRHSLAVARFEHAWDILKGLGSQLPDAVRLMAMLRQTVRAAEKRGLPEDAEAARRAKSIQSDIDAWPGTGGPGRCPPLDLETELQGTRWATDLENPALSYPDFLSRLSSDQGLRDSFTADPVATARRFGLAKMQMLQLVGDFEWSSVEDLKAVVAILQSIESDAADLRGSVESRFRRP